MVIKHCLICNKKIRVYPSHLKSKKTCSRKCWSTWRKQSGVLTGKNNPAYKGGTAVYETSPGLKYRFIRGNSKKVSEHRYVMEQYLDRKLKSYEEVHHINGDTLNNNIENLFVLDKKHHSRKHFQLFKYVQQLERENLILRNKLVYQSWAAESSVFRVGFFTAQGRISIGNVRV